MSWPSMSCEKADQVGVSAVYLPGYILIYFLFKEYKMLHYSIIFFVIAIVAGVLGFGGIAGSAAGIAKILFGGFLILAILSLIFGRKR